MKSGRVSLISKRTDDFITMQNYHCIKRRNEIIAMWDKQYGLDKCWLQISPDVNENGVDEVGLNCKKRHERFEASNEKSRRQRPLAIYSNRTPFNILDEFTQPSQ